MNALRHALTAAVLTLLAAFTLTSQSVYPTGTTIYDPSQTWNGFTVLSPLRTQAVIVIDMNGNVVKQWDGFVNSAGGPARVLPDGVVMGANGSHAPHQESLELVGRYEKLRSDSGYRSAVQDRVAGQLERLRAQYKRPRLTMDANHARSKVDRW